ncbi:hypothetical protein [Nocardioides marinquilinus]|uniref:hypothetical protein n=1 Tax=Nocardioides marinquilinus TaxID=1210400 RepID=UPI0031EF1905
MLAMPSAGFCFLAMTKTGSTAVESALGRYAEIAVRRPPRLKHMSARTFDSVWAPVLEHYGHPRESYELTCVVREPVAWAHSWFRYRARPEVAGRPNYTGDLTFAQFAERIVAGDVDLGSSARFVRTRPDRPDVTHVWRYENLGDAVAWMAGRLGVDVPEVARVNASPDRPDDGIDPAVRRMLERHFAADLAVYEAAR